MDMKKTISFEAAGHEFEVPVDFSAIEVVESVYQLNVEMVMTQLADPAMIMRTKVARVISTWPKQMPKGLRRQEVYESVVTTDSDNLARYVGTIQGALGFALGYISETQLDTLARGEDLEEEPVNEVGKPEEAS